MTDKFMSLGRAIAKRGGQDFDEILANYRKPEPGFIPWPERAEYPDGSLLSAKLYDCPLCLNHGMRNYRDEYGKIHLYECRCMPKRKELRRERDNQERLKRSGLSRANRYTFETWQTLGEEWRETVRFSARQYATDLHGWFLMSGSTGTGKTHICTAICNEAIRQGREVRYIMWREDIPRAKQLVTDFEQYQGTVRPWKECDVLYVDDLFKTGRASDGKLMRPTAADINIAYEILNYRYTTEKATVVSTELLPADLLQVDGAVGGRILEMAEGHIVNTSGRQNWRLR